MKTQNNMKNDMIYCEVKREEHTGMYSMIVTL